jgi:hypothetical protein
MTKGSEFESRQGQAFSVLHVVQTGSGAHEASYPMGNEGSFFGSKAARACRNQENMGLYINSPIRLYVVVFN